MSLFGSLELGKKSLFAAQQGQAVSGHNIANVDTEGFSRQEVVQAAGRPMDGKVHGVDITEVRRIEDGFTRKKIIQEQNSVGSWETRNKVLNEAEAIFTDLDGKRLRGDLNAFWDSWNAVANEPESITMRRTLISKSESLIEGFKGFHRRFSGFRQNINAKIMQEFEDVNQMLRDLAQLNTQVQQLEAQGLTANDARDQREQTLKELSDIVDVRYFEGPNGTLEIQVPNGQHLVHDRRYFQLKPIMDSDDAINVRVGLGDEIGVTSDITDVLKGGRIKEYVEQRDGNIKKYRDDMNEMVREIVFNVNSIHSQGTGINSASYIEESAYRFDQTSQTRPLPFLKTGSFELKLVDMDNEITELIQVDVDGGVDTVQSIDEKINSAAGAYEVIDEEGTEAIKEHTRFKALINEDGNVSLRTGEGNRFIFGGDSSGIFALLGLNSFFHSQDGVNDLELNQDLVEKEMMIAAGTDLIPGDNQIAMKIAELQQAPTMNDKSVNFDQFFNNQITDVGLKVQDASKGLKGHQQMLDQYEKIRDSVSSVNMDEEMTHMVKYQRAYESSAKFLSTIDQMTQTVINM
ncbi:MAG: flagellar hook-associated protein FlgK [Proteobacteria bacterium]|nr:flagellar hook-associated protein FlgK [Pseudomonadota bacterium]